MTINNRLKEYIEQEILPLYFSFDKAHNIDHAQQVIEQSLELAKHYDVYILSTSPWNNPTAASDKIEWVKKHMNEIFHKRVILTHHKELCQGDYLIDDRSKNGASEFKGEWIHLGSKEFPDMDAVLSYLLM